MICAAGRIARSLRRASRGYAARRWRCSNRRERSPAPQADGGSCKRQDTLFGMSSVQPAEDKAKKSAPARRIALPMRPRLPFRCPRTSCTVTVKMPALLPAPRQSCHNNNTSEHAGGPPRAQDSCPSGTASLRARVALSRVPCFECWQLGLAEAPAETHH